MNEQAAEQQQHQQLDEARDGEHQGFLPVNTLLPTSMLWTSAICAAFSNINLMLLPPVPPRARFALGIVVVLLTFSASAAHLRSFLRSGGFDRRTLGPNFSYHITNSFGDNDVGPDQRIMRHGQMELWGVKSNLVSGGEGGHIEMFRLIGKAELRGLRTRLNRSPTFQSKE